VARDGARVAINYAGDESSAQEALELVRNADTDARTYRADVPNPEEIRSLFASVEKDFGGLDIFVANAGRGVIKPVLELTEDDDGRLQSGRVCRPSRLSFPYAQRADQELIRADQELIKDHGKPNRKRGFSPKPGA
jgi:NAD(P)-dependent dehydrogenase (short-subunit alcohol dehydrogenase family)